MPLITSTTALNKIKWGNDRYDEGSSNQPYIKRDIPGVNVNDPNPTIVNDDSNPPAVGGLDFLWRGGLSAPIDAARDVSRLTQMFFDTKSPNGFEFIAKYNLLSRTAVKTEASYGIGYGGTKAPDFVKGTGGGAVNAGIYTPLSTLGQAAVGFTGTHLNALGLDPSSPMSGVVSGGLFPGAGLTTYLDTIRENNNQNNFAQKEEEYEVKERNPLYIQQIQNIPFNEELDGNPKITEDEFILTKKTRMASTSEDGFKNRLVDLFNQKIDIKFTGNDVITYSGGPGSILGIGKTVINFADQRTGINNIEAISDPSYFYGGVYGKDRYQLSPQWKDFEPKLGASEMAATVIPGMKILYNTEGESYTDSSKLTSINTKQSTFKNAFLPTAFWNPTGSNNYGAFLNTSDGVTSGSINYENETLLPAMSASFAQGIVTDEEYANIRDTGSIQNQTTPQSTFKNAKIDGSQGGSSFFNPDGPDNYSVFGVKNVLLDKSKIFISGSSVSYAYSGVFPNLEPIIFEGLSIEAPGGLRLFDNNVYDPNTLINVGQEEGGAMWANGALTMTQTQLTQQQSYQTNPQIRDFRKTIIESDELADQFSNGGDLNAVSSVISLAPDYTSKSANRRINRGDPGKQNTALGQKNVFNYGIPATEGYALDKITAMPMYDGSGPNTSLAINDFVKFRIAAINNDSTSGQAVYMHFRAFIDSFNDNYNSTWDPVKYSGRGEDLYNYSGFSRTINLSFTCYAQSKPELIPMYKKLNYLASTLAPDYTGAGFMRGNLIRLTLGGYLYEQPGFITSLTYDVPSVTPWEISIDAEGGGDGSVKELPHMIKVSNLSFTPIHKFLAQKPNNARTPNERYIALSTNSGKGNYNDLYQEQKALGDGDNNNTNNIPGEGS